MREESSINSRGQDMLRGTRATHFVRYEEIQLGKAAAQVMVLFAERGVKEGQEITWSYGDSYKSHRKEMGYRAGTKANPNAITPQQARTAFARCCKKGPLAPDSERGREERGREEANGDDTSSKGHDEQVDNGQNDGEDEETRDDGRRDEEDGGEGRDSAAVGGGDNDGEGEGTKTRTEDEDINWEDD